MGTRTQGRKAERGAAAVEFALVLPLLMLILLGTIDWGYYFYVEQLVTNAAREGARTGSLTPCPGGEAVAKAQAEAAANAYLVAAGLTGAATAVADGTCTQVAITVTYPTGSISGFDVLSAILPANAWAQAVMRR